MSVNNADTPITDADPPKRQRNNKRDSKRSKKPPQDANFSKQIVKIQSETTTATENSSKQPHQQGPAVAKNNNTTSGASSSSNNRNRNRNRNRNQNRGKPGPALDTTTSNVVVTVKPEDMMTVEELEAGKKVVAAEDNQAALVEAPAAQQTSTHQFSNVPFASLKNICAESKRSLKEVMKYELMTKVQNETLPVILSGNDVLAKAKTGSGKTTAFLLPIIENIAKARKQQSNNKGNSNNIGISALIISPTRELTTQIATEVKALATFHNKPPIRTVTLMGGTSFPKDTKNLAHDQVDIIVATPGRLQDHLIKNTSNIAGRLARGLRTLCLDEADRLLDMGFRAELKKIIGYLPKKRQTLLFSATLPDDLEEITCVAMRPGHTFVDTVGTEERNVNVQVIQEYTVLPLAYHIQALERAICQHMDESNKSSYKIIVFFNTARTAGFMASLFRAAKYPILEMHSRKSQAYRTKVAKQFTEQNNVIMFSSDVSARGVDYPDVSLIVQMGLTDRENYVHRLGRTGRAGRQGRGLLILSDFERGFLNEISDLKPTLNNSVFVSNGDVALDTPVGKFTGRLERNKELKKDAEMAYQAFLGYYNSNLKRLKITKEDAVAIANEYSSICGLREPPALLARTVGKMGMKGVPGIRIGKRE
eukprot:CAMPEP_0196805372 /NCGR_PEP_ID=MMETSP1362-20130617/5136_1 /TAXON_ID=163516 /ORGANISM="Leptocylindrus danicus, Strain CCMP1856" /LENGTH=649 /DNA_ID=CAMNT_0042178255 /DNA_START=448 /DNA_END=2397 /DNA_ORIENTATION=+